MHKRVNLGCMCVQPEFACVWWKIWSVCREKTCVFWERVWEDTQDCNFSFWCSAVQHFVSKKYSGVYYVWFISIINPFVHAFTGTVHRTGGCMHNEVYSVQSLLWQCWQFVSGYVEVTIICFWLIYHNGQLNCSSIVSKWVEIRSCKFVLWDTKAFACCNIVLIRIKIMCSDVFENTDVFVFFWRFSPCNFGCSCMGECCLSCLSESIYFPISW